MTTPKNELEILFPHNPITLNGEKFNIQPFKFGKWPEVIKKATKIVTIIIETYQNYGEAALEITVDPESNKFKLSPEALQLVLKLLTTGGEEVLDILAISIDRPRQWVNDLDGDEGVQLLAGTYLVNRDFFSERVLPQFLKMSERLLKVKSQATLEDQSPGEK